MLEAGNTTARPKRLGLCLPIYIYKKTRDKSDCSNYSSITPLSVANKVIARNLLNRMIPSTVEEHAPEKQCGLRANRQTTDMIFVLRQDQEKYREQNMSLYAAFIDLTEAFDTFNCDCLWKVLSRLGYPPKFPVFLRQLHDSQMGKVKYNGSLTECFPTSPFQTVSGKGVSLHPPCSPSFSA